MLKKQEAYMLSITANELKTKGVSILDNETVITVRGKRKFVVIDFDYYQYLRECELSRAIEDTKKDIENGRFIKESVKNHLKKLRNGL